MLFTALLLLLPGWLGEPAVVAAKSAREAGSECAARSTKDLWKAGVKPRPLTLDRFPRPPGDTGRGVHWLPTTAQSAETVDRLLAEAAAMRVSWITFLNEGAEIGDNDYFVRRAVERGIEPVMRVYAPHGTPVVGGPEALGELVRHYRKLGVRYFQLFNEPNLAIENVDGQPNIDRYVAQWVDAARPVIEHGGLPGFGALSPGGHFNDLEFLDGALTRLEQRREIHLLDCAWLAVHNYSFNRPVIYADDQHGYTSFRHYHLIIERRLGRAMPMIGTEGGTHVGAAFDPAYPAVDAALQAQLVVDGYRYLTRPDREPYYFAFSYWIIADEGHGVAGPAGAPPPLFGQGGPSPIVGLLQQLPAEVPRPAVAVDDEPAKKKSSKSKKSKAKAAKADAGKASSPSRRGIPPSRSRPQAR
jgi:hypothetical protein